MSDMTNSTEPNLAYGEIVVRQRHGGQLQLHVEGEAPDGWGREQADVWLKPAELTKVVEAAHPALRVMLDANTAHLDRASRNWIDRMAWEDKGTHAATELGWFCYVPPDDEAFEPNTPPVMRAILRFARELGAAYVLFDRDAPELAELPTFENFGTEPRRAAAPRP